MIPILFSEICGQEKAKRLLAKAFTSRRMPHAFLFRGMSGIGKARAAQALAARVNCRSRKESKRRESAEEREGGQNLDPCGECRPCKKYQKGIHPDFQRITPQKGAIKIEQIRRLRENLDYPPYEAEVRVTVLEDVHTMRSEAANALLKTLEEPYAGNILILTAAETQGVLSTIASRCQQITFTALSRRDTEDILIREGISRQEAALLSLLSGGSPGEALLLREYQIVPLWLEVVGFLMNPQNMQKKDGCLIELLELAAKMAELKSELPYLFALLRRWLRDLLLADEEALALYCGEYRELWAGWSSHSIFRRQEALDMAEKQIMHNCNPLLICETLLFALQGIGRQG